MQHYLVKFSKDWADEFEVYGFEVIDEDRYQEIMSVKDSTLTISRCFGTNEGWDDTEISEFISAMEFIPISEAEVKTLSRLFPSYRGSDLIQFGYVPEVGPEDPDEMDEELDYSDFDDE